MRTVDQNSISACRMISLGTSNRLINAPAGNKGFDTRYDGKIGIRLGILASLDFAAKLVDVGERLLLARDKTIGLGK